MLMDSIIYKKNLYKYKVTSPNITLLTRQLYRFHSGKFWRKMHTILVQRILLFLLLLLAGLSPQISSLCIRQWNCPWGWNWSQSPYPKWENEMFQWVIKTKYCSISTVTQLLMMMLCFCPHNVDTAVLATKWWYRNVYLVMIQLGFCCNLLDP